MELDRSFSMRSAIFFSLFLMGFVASASSSTFISDSIFESQSSIGRNLLQAKKGCSVNFEFLNYTIITSQCKGPKYPADRCCSAFTDFACPYANVLNDLSNDCASTMFSYINLYGNYPPGLFASECRGGKQGLECPAASPSALADDVNGSRTQTTAFPSPLQMLAAAFLVLLLQLL
ncbi:hypothetical protein UlMin_003991 [Ulmus minor]